MTDQITRLEVACKERNRKELNQIARELGFINAEKGGAIIDDLNDVIGSCDDTLKIVQSAMSSADPETALAYAERLANDVGKNSLLALLKDDLSLKQLLTVTGASPFLANVLCRMPDLIDKIFVQRGIDSKKDLPTMTSDLAALAAMGTPESPITFDELQRQLRVYKHREFVRIGARDLCGLAELEEVTDELSSLASVTLEAGYQVCRRMLVADYGEAMNLEDPENPVLSEFTVLGMGKFGGNELNFSSDIDLIYFYDTDTGSTTGVETPTGTRKGVISIHEFFCRLGEMLMKAIGAPTADGFVFRVDLRLRPEGNSGEVAISCNAAEDYYQSWGQSWERAAMIKARPVAGSHALGEVILTRLNPFIFRRFLDFGMIDDMKLMKRKIDKSLVRKEGAEVNLKLGRGGIREIEFFIQAIQVVNGGKNPILREKNSLKALTILRDEGVISAEKHQLLSDAYRFLRTTEHRIQVEQERQTHSLPTKESDMAVLARRSGFADTVSFLSELEGHRQTVNRIFNNLFYSHEEEEREIDPEVLFILDQEADSDPVKDILESHGFSNPDIAYESIIKLRNGNFGRPLDPKGRRLLDTITPQLVEEIINSPDPDLALANLERFIEALRARSTFFALLVENSSIIKLLISLFGTSQFLSRIFIQHPEILDSLVARTYAVAIKESEQMAEELETAMSDCIDYEAKLDMLRRYRNEEFLRIAVNDITHNLKQGEGAIQLSRIADVCLNKAVSLAREELIPRFGLPFYIDGDERREIPFAVVGMGKLGGMELNYHSDLDIIFIYEGRGVNLPVEGTELDRFREVSTPEYFSKLAQRIISILTLKTREGHVYEIDTRLRPSGNQGPLVTSLAAFKDYHQESAQLWERQALSKARVSVGPQPFVEKIEPLIARLVYERPLPNDTQREIARLRKRMEEEIGKESKSKFNIKTGHGGLVDVEFIVQYLQLVHGRKNSSLRHKNSINALAALRDAAVIDESVYESLASGYKFLRRLENKLRILHDQSVSDLSSDRKYLTKLAKHLGYPAKPIRPDVAFIKEYQEVTHTIRKIFLEILGEFVSDGGNGADGSIVVDGVDGK